jgi:hypothetical protein
MADLVREQAGAATGRTGAAPRRVAVVFNPVTGGGDRARRRRDTEEALARAGLEVLWLETTPQDPGQGATRRAVAEGVDLVMAQGGDGTVAACVTGLAGSDVPLACCPAGRATCWRPTSTSRATWTGPSRSPSTASGAAWTSASWATTAS